MNERIQLSDTEDSSPATRKYIRKRLFEDAVTAVNEGSDIDAVAQIYKIPRFYLEGEPVPKHYFDDPPIDEIDEMGFNWRLLYEWCKDNNRDCLTISREELRMFRKA